MTGVPEDQLGRLNLMGPEQVLKGIAEVNVAPLMACTGVINRDEGADLQPDPQEPILFGKEVLVTPAEQSIAICPTDTSIPHFNNCSRSKGWVTWH